MRFKLYTTVDITHSNNRERSIANWQDQNFATVLQTIGLRANISYSHGPDLIVIKGRLLGFNTDEIINVWRFDFNSYHDDCFADGNDPVGLLKRDFELVPFISGLGESIEQNYDVFVADGDNPNIIFVQM